MTDHITTTQVIMNNELTNVDIKLFASMVDKDYDNAMMECISYAYACEELLPVSRVIFYSGKLQRCFPICHFVFAKIVLSCYYSIPKEQQIINKDEMTILTKLHNKQRMILFFFCGLICAKSTDLLKHWAQAKTLAFFFKGFTQPMEIFFLGWPAHGHSIHVGILVLIFEYSPISTVLS